MPLYKVEIAPGVFERVEAANPSDARKLVKAQIMKGTLNPVINDLFFDSETGVDDLQIRRLLSRAETYEEKESVLRNYVGSSGFTRTSDGQLALTPTGLRARGQPVQTKTLNDGTVLELNTIIDANKFEGRADIADFAGIAGPVIGSVYGVLPQSRLYKGLRGLSGGNVRFQRILGSGFGGAGGKGIEEVADAVQGFQLQDAQDLAYLGIGELALGAGGQAVGEGAAALYRMHFGAKAPISTQRLANQAAKGRDVLDIKKLDESLGKEATEAQIKKAVAEGKVKSLDSSYAIALQGLDVNLGARTQQIAEAVLKSSREKGNINYLKELFDTMTDSFRKRGATLNAYVDDVTADSIGQTINQTKRNLEMATNEAAKVTKNTVEDLADSFIATAPYRDAPGMREYGEQVLDLLGNAKGVVNRQVGDMYDAVDDAFFSVAKYDGLNPANATAKAIENVIDHYKRKGIQAIDYFKARQGIDPKLKLGGLEDPIGDINVRNVLEAEQEIRNLGRPLPRFDQDFAEMQPFGKLTRVLETKRKLNAFISQANDSKERELFYTLTRLLDDADLHALKGEDFLKNNPKEADSIFTVLGLNGREIIKLENAKGKNIFGTMSFDEIKKINESIDLLREADRLNAKLNEPFKNATIKNITNAARGTGAFDPDEVYDKLIFNGSLRQLDDFFKAVDDYDKYLKNHDKAEFATNLNRVKTQTAQKLFANAFDKSIDPVTDMLNYTAFAKEILKFESKHPGKINSLFKASDGTSSGPTILKTINQLIKVAPKLKSTDVEDLVKVFRGQDGLSTTPKGRAFINALEAQAKASAREADLLANRNLSELPNRTPSEIVETIFRPKNSENIARLKNMMEPDDFAKVQEASIGRLLEDAIDYNVKGGNVTDIFKAKNLNKALDQYSDETLEAMFGKEFTKDLKHFADTIDVLTKGEIGRGNFPGAIVAAGIGAAIIFQPLASLSTLAGLEVAKRLLGSKLFIKYASKTDKGSIAQAFEIFRRITAQLGYRYVNGELIKGTETITNLLEENIPDFSETDIVEQPEQTRAPQVNISLPQVAPVQISDPLRQAQQDRIEFAERLFRRPVI
jgi:hypothetical protein|tara:strand:+ start:4558 stop:7818 length:3261 start_codon:yes stop_codon:yes gene_type:complete